MQEEIPSGSQELQASLEEAQRKMRIWEAKYRDLEAEQLPKEILLTKLSMQCEVRPGAGGPQDTGPEPWADSLGLSQVRVGPHWHLCQRLCGNVTQRPRGSQRHLKGTSTLAGGDVLEKTSHQPLLLYFLNLFFLI